MYKRLLVIILLISGFALAARAQNPVLNNRDTKKDTINRHRDSVTSKPFVPKIKHDELKYHPDSLHSPHKAVIRSLIIPGWGQVYNHQWWKVPLIYAGLGLLGDVIIYNQRQYGPLLKAAQDYEHNTPPAPGASEYAIYQAYSFAPSGQIDTDLDAVERNRDLGIMGFLAGWGIQMVDAYIDAKFQHSYTMDTDFSFRIDPTILNQQNMFVQGSTGPVMPGIKLSLTF